MRWSSPFPVASIAFLFCIVDIAVSLTVINRVLDDERVHYNGHRLYRIWPTTLEHRQILTDMRNEEGYSFWSNLGTRDVSADVMVSPEKLSKFHLLVSENLMSAQELMANVQQFIDNENPLLKSRTEFGWDAYHDLDSINRWMEGLAGEYPTLVTPLVGGESYEMRIIKGVKLSFKEGNPGVFLEGGIHAREWISPAVVTYILNELITSTDPNVRGVAESYDWYVFPVFNPDGYDYTHKTNRLWRKTRRPYTSRCFGADPNRNWDFHWNGEFFHGTTSSVTGITVGESCAKSEKGSSRDPCSETFAGGSAFSETEMKTMSEFVASIKDKIFAYISFHSYSQVILLPYGYTNVHVDNYADLMEIGNASANALAKRYGTRYQVGNVVDILYVASGSSMDWVRGTLNTSITLTYELRDRGQFGFLLPAIYIIPTGEETLDSLVALLQEAQRLGYGIEIK